MGLQCSDIIEFVFVQVAVFLIFTCLKRMLNLVLKRVYDYNLPVANYREEFFNFFLPCFLKIPSFFLKMFEDVIHLVQNAKTRSSNLPQTMSGQEIFGYPIDNELPNISPQANSSNSAIDQSENLPYEVRFSNLTGDYLQPIPSEYSSNNSNGNQSRSLPTEDGSGDQSRNISSQVGFTYSTEDQSNNMLNQDISGNPTGDHSLRIPTVYTSYNSNGNQAPSEDDYGVHSPSEIGFDGPTEDHFRIDSKNTQDVSSNPAANQYASLDASVSNVTFNENNIQPQSDNESLTSQKSRVQGRKRLSSTRERPPGAWLFRSLGKFYRAN